MRQISSQARIVALDLETTGLSARRDRVVELAAVCWQGGEEIGHFQALVNPGRSIPQAAIAVHGITNDMVRHQPPIGELLPAFLDFCRADVLVAHNAPFDLGFLAVECARLGLAPLNVPSVDTCALARRRVPGLPSYRLEVLKGVLGLGLGQEHRALQDARDCLALFLHCQRQGPITVRLPIPPIAPLPPEYALITDALRTGGTVWIEYVDSRGKITSREIRPLMADASMVQAYCLLRNEKRHFSLDRIRRVWQD